ncbi:serine/threonine-protein kinase [Aestuariivita sp.]|jgi:serine/threonine protein kinase|uniref:serine/threonine protein kinase n=1 Tax=Aestuariivita sp. TaxID=1872407 RepID=UPI00216CC1E8|nr:serine/threonine-protein kinase [Aestuariivita sp.]MCE8008135.1 serine/threonine protein kinase [Aestuariivita sp.]
MQQGLVHSGDDMVEELPPGTALLHGQYIIERNLVRGGFGLTYLARDSLERRVVIKECFPNAICIRKDRDVVARLPDQTQQFASITRHFLREARRMSRLKHPNIVGVHQVFEENGTAYMALDYLDGVDLLMVIEEKPERLRPDLIRELMHQALRAIGYIHGQGILHRDISPDNFLLGWDDTLTLIDFGAAREHATKAHRALSALLAVKDGYSPQEFYLSGVSQTEASDLYSLGATFYHIITGEAPPHSQERLAAVATESGDPYRPLAGRIEGFDTAFLGLIDRALGVFPETRPQSATEWLVAIESHDTPTHSVTAQTEGPTDEVDLTIAGEISRLVQDTNRDLEQGKPGDLKRIARNMKKVCNPLDTNRVAPQTETPDRQPVDIFGNPIEDVAQWLREQDRQIARETGSEATPPPEQTATPDPTERPRSLKSLLGRLMPSPTGTNRSCTN